jgi:hypothetical protein
LSRGHGGASAKKKPLLIKPNKSGFSGGEKDLYREHDQILKKRAAKEEAEE